MIDTNPDALLALIAGGESQMVEFKTLCPPEHGIAQILTSFANTEGGILLVGVGNDGRIEGLSDQDWNIANDMLRKVCASIFQWPMKIGSVLIQNYNIIYAEVDKAPSHYFPVATSRGKFYRRKGARIVAFTPNTQAMPAKIAFTAVASQRSLTVFVAMSFREEEEPALVDYFRAIQRAVEATRLPLKLSRADLVEGDFEISQKVMEEINRADIVIADFTLNSANVYFELGYARGRQRRIIQTARKGTMLEFDIRSWRTLFYRNATEFEEKLISELKAAYSEVVDSA